MFYSPYYFLLFIPIAAIIVFLYLLKMKRIEHIVSAIMFWQESLADIEANSPFQKLKKNLLLILQLSVLAALVFSVAQPFIKSKSISNSKTVVVIDSSGSMRSTDIYPSRFEDAKRRALKIVSGVSRANTMLVMTASNKAKVEASFTSDKKKLSNIISALRPTDAECDMQQALILALSLVSEKSAVPPRIIILSDGNFNSLSDIVYRDAVVDFVSIGKNCDNVAITGMASRKTFNGSRQVYIEIKNLSNDNKAFNLEISRNGDLFNIREIKMKPRSASQHMIDLPMDVSGRITAVLNVKDDLKSDNFASVYTSGKRNINALLISKGNIFLQNAFSMDSDIQLSRISSIPKDLAKLDYDIVIFDGIDAPDKLSPGNYLLVNSSSASAPSVSGDLIQNPTVIDFPADHPINAYVNYSNIKIAKAHRLISNGWGTPLLESETGIIGFAGRRNGINIVQLSWDLMESDFPLHTAFPIFIANCIDWFVPYKDNTGRSVKTGQSIDINVASDIKNLMITDSYGKKYNIDVKQNPVLFDETINAGVYKIKGNAEIKEFASNILSSHESDTLPKKSLAIGDKNLNSEGRSIYSNRQYYWLFIMIALCILMIEWYIYHRRI